MLKSLIFRVTDTEWLTSSWTVRLIKEQSERRGTKSGWRSICFAFDFTFDDSQNYALQRFGKSQKVKKKKKKKLHKRPCPPIKIEWNQKRETLGMRIETTWNHDCTSVSYSKTQEIKPWQQGSWQESLKTSVGWPGGPGLLKYITLGALIIALFFASDRAEW